jgi:hypothetical protein
MSRDTAVAETVAREAKYSNLASNQCAPDMKQILIKGSDKKKELQFAPQSRSQVVS